MKPTNHLSLCTKLFKRTSLIVPLIIILIVVSGCTMTVLHKFAEGYSPNGENYFDKIISTQDLGVGYDLVRTDPDDWALNSVKESSVRPRVFEFEPDPNPSRIIDIPQLEGPATRRILPKGVFAETNSRFQWSEDIRFVYSATDFKNSHGGSFSVTGGAAVASFTASASFKKINESVSEDESSFAYKDGAFRGHKMEMDPDYTHKLTTQFRRAVQGIDSDSTAYNFINHWGTHYTSSTTIGARCAYRFEYSKMNRTSVAGNETEFELGVSGGVKAVEVGTSASYNESNMNTVKSATGTENVDFVSYGGSGAAIDSFAEWTKHAVNNPTVVDVYLESYETLFNERYFPGDSLITQKARYLTKALEEHFKKGEDNTTAVSSSFDYEWVDALFEVRVFNLRHTMVGDNYEAFYYGNLRVLPYDKDYEAFAPIDNSDSEQYSKTLADFSQWIWIETGEDNNSKWGPVTSGQILDIPEEKSIIFRVKADQIATGFISLIGLFKENWAGTSPIKSVADDDNRINFSGVEDGGEVVKKIDFTMNQDLSKTLTVSAEMRLKRLIPNKYGAWSCAELIKVFEEMTCEERKTAYDGVDWTSFLDDQFLKFGCDYKPFQDLRKACRE